MEVGVKGDEHRRGNSAGHNVLAPDPSRLEDKAKESSFYFSCPGNYQGLYMNRVVF